MSQPIQISLTPVSGADTRLALIWLAPPWPAVSHGQTASNHPDAQK
jgi:hypothetical protein